MISVRAFAKINLTLRVLGVLADGYHQLRTIYQSIALHDTLTFRWRSGPFRLECDEPACPAGEANLVWQAADRLRAAAGRRGAPRDFAIRLEKRIPMQAGLGGGSSDAAMVLAVLARRWRVDQVRVREIAASLGADVPYFLEGGAVLGLERGDLLYPLVDPAPFWVALVVPPFGVSTTEAYRWWDGRSEGAPSAAARHRDAKRRVPGVRLQRREKGWSLREIDNDLQPIVAAHHPEIARMVEALTRSGAAHAAMSGSGSAVFGLFEDRRDAERALDILGLQKCRRFLTRTVNRATYQRLAGIPQST